MTRHTNIIRPSLVLARKSATAVTKEIVERLADLLALTRFCLVSVSAGVFTALSLTAWSLSSLLAHQSYVQALLSFLRSSACSAISTALFLAARCLLSFLHSSVWPAVSTTLFLVAQYLFSFLRSSALSAVSSALFLAACLALYVHQPCQQFLQLSLWRHSVC